MDTGEDTGMNGGRRPDASVPTVRGIVCDMLPLLSLSDFEALSIHFHPSDFDGHIERKRT